MSKSHFDKVIALPWFKFTMIVVAIAGLIAFALWREPNMTLTFLAGCLAGGGLKSSKVT